MNKICKICGIFVSTDRWVAHCNSNLHLKNKEMEE
jgi:hypothetical protein